MVCPVEKTRVTLGMICSPETSNGNFRNLASSSRAFF